MPEKKRFNRPTLVVVLVVLVLVLVVGYFRYSAVGKKAGPPTEQEVSDLFKDAFATCIPKTEWDAKIVSLGGQILDEPFCVTHGPGMPDSQPCEEWIKGKYECQVRNVADDHFVSFKKTDGKLTAQSQYQTAEHYTMYGVLTVFYSGKEVEQKVEIQFERRESGWVTGIPGLAFSTVRGQPTVTIPR